MQKKFIEMSELKDSVRYLVDFGKEVDFMDKAEISGYRVFGNLDIWNGDYYVGTLARKSYAELYAH